MPEANIKTIKSSDYATAGHPAPFHLEQDAFFWVEGLAQQNVARSAGRTVGRRLYVYMSGHGFSTTQREGCLITADALPTKINANVCASAWLQWWQDAGYFREFVLLLDCCMNRMTTGLPMRAPLAGLNASMPPGPSFVAFAAKRPLKAVEMPVPADNGRFHGIFTWAFLDGVKGAAVNAAGTVTGQSMGNWLRNALYQRMGPSERTNRDISQEPEIGSNDPQLVLARPTEPLRFEIALSFPADAIGKKTRLWSGVPPRARTFNAAAKFSIKVQPGLHVVEVPEAGYRQGFEVVGDGVIQVEQKGPPSMMPLDRNANFALFLDAGDPANTITIDTAAFETVDSATGRIETRLRSGIYRSRIRVGNAFVDQIFLLDRPSDLAAFAEAQPTTSMGVAPALGLAVETFPDPVALPQLASPIPFERAPMSSERHSRQVALLASAPEPTEAQVAVVARSWMTSETEPSRLPEEAGHRAGAGQTRPRRILQDWNPWPGLRLVDERGRTVADVPMDGERDQTEAPYGSVTVDVPSGRSFLRLADPFGDMIEMALPTVKGWRLEVYLLRVGTETYDDPPRISVILRRATGEIWMKHQNDLLEKAMIALSEERSILNKELETLLLRKFSNPIEGIVGAHLLLIQAEADRKTDLGLMDEVVTNLRDLVGREHSDVEALSLQCPSVGLRRTKPFRTPPLFERSWQLIVEASRSAPNLVPLSLWQRVKARSVLPPYLAWSVDPVIKRQYGTALVRAARIELAPTVPPDRQPIEPLTTDTALREFALDFAAPAAPVDDLEGGRTPRSRRRRGGGRRAGIDHAPDSSRAVENGEKSAEGTRDSLPAQSVGARRFAEAYQLPPAALAALKGKLDRKH
ncbi:hypothetical protein [Methylobacterium oxalidis]|uniref:hypothetical protein n=1 Tax=Methylobacterium oxalidis TaxID=944322 RepID=UPI0033150331